MVKRLHALPVITLLLLLLFFASTAVIVHAGMFSDEFTSLNTRNWQVIVLSSGRAGYSVSIYNNNFLVLYRSENAYIYIDLDDTLLANAYTDATILVSLGAITIDTTSIEAPDLTSGQTYRSSTVMDLVYLLLSSDGTIADTVILVSLNITLICGRATPSQEPWIDYICHVIAQVEISWIYMASYGKETIPLFWGHCYIDKDQSYLGRSTVFGTTQIAISLKKTKTTVSYTTSALYYYNPYFGETGTEADYKWEPRNYSGTVSRELQFGVVKIRDFKLGGQNYVVSTLPSGSTNRYGLSQEVYYDYVIISYTEPPQTTTPAPTIPTTPPPTTTTTPSPTPSPTPTTTPPPTGTPTTPTFEIGHREIVIFFVIVFALAVFARLLKAPTPTGNDQY